MQRRKLDHVDTAVPESSSPDIFKTGEDSGHLRVRSEEGEEQIQIFEIGTSAPLVNKPVPAPYVEPANSFVV